MSLRYPPPGRLWDVGGFRLHAKTQAAAAGAAPAPTVVFDAALGGSSLGWVFVERAVAGFAATCSYDRAGLGWSDPGPLPRDLPAMVAELRAVLEAAAAPPPYILVGHSFGALTVRLFAAQYPAETAGVVLVDPPALAEWGEPDAEHGARLERGIRLARSGVWAARCGIAQGGAWLIEVGAFRLAAALATVVSGGKLRTRADFNFTPAAKLPPELKPVMRWLWTRPRFYTALAQQMEALPAACRCVAAAPALGEVPLVVLSAHDAPASQVAEHAAVALQSRRGQHRIAKASGHWIPLEEPELVVEAIHWVAQSARGCAILEP